MAKFIQVALIVALAVACCAQPARLTKRKQSRLARQEVAPEEEVPSQTPYPPAGIIPEIAFDLPSEGSSLEPKNTYLPPDNVGGVPAQTYGPPEVTDDATEDVADDAEPTDVSVAEATDVDISAAEDEPEAEVEADQPEEPEDLEQPQQQDSADEEVDDNEVDNQQFERLVRRRPAKLRAAKIQALPAAVALAPQRLVAAPIQAVAPQQFIFANGRFFAYNPQLLRV